MALCIYLHYSSSVAKPLSSNFCFISLQVQKMLLLYIHTVIFFKSADHSSLVKVNSDVGVVTKNPPSLKGLKEHSSPIPY